LEVVWFPSDIIVQDNDFLYRLFEKLVYEVRTDKPGPSNH